MATMMCMVVSCWSARAWLTGTRLNLTSTDTISTSYSLSRRLRRAGSFISYSPLLFLSIVYFVACEVIM
eukprot:8699753-Pyramimonas_sp.AAC.1